MGAGLHNRRSRASEASLGGLREKHFSYGYGTTRRPLSQPAIAECKCTSSRVGALTPAAKRALQAAYCARASYRCCLRCSTSCISCCSWWHCYCTVPARAPCPDLAPAAVRWPVWPSGAARTEERASAPLCRSSISASASAFTSSSCCRPCARRATEAPDASRLAGAACAHAAAESARALPAPRFERARAVCTAQPVADRVAAA